MATINGKALVKDRKPLDRVYSNGQLVYGRNLLVGIDKTVHQAPNWNQLVTNVPTKFIKLGQPLCFSAFINNAPYAGATIRGYAVCAIQAKDLSGNVLLQKDGNKIDFNADGVSQASLIVPDKTDSILLFVRTGNMLINTYYGYPKAEFGSIATPWTPAPEDYI